MPSKFPFGVSRSRVKLLLGFSILIWFSLLLRLAQIQIISGPGYARMAEEQEKGEKLLAGTRGMIFDRNGEVLAQNLPAYSFFSFGESLASPRYLATVFSGQLSEAEIRAKKSQKGFVWLVRGLEKSEAQRIRKPAAGIYSVPEERRFYPYYPLGVDWLGFTDIDRRGQAGLELYYDGRLSGDSARRELLRDARGNLYLVDKSETAARPGKNLLTTIDINMQAILEMELAAGIEKSRAASGTGVFLDPKTGEILAMVYLPAGRPDPRQSRQKNRVVADIFEPGSTFKVVTAAAALEEKKFSAGDRIYCEKGVFQIGKNSLHDVHRYESLTFEDAVVKSSNIALAKIGLAVGGPALYRTARKFGFGEKTGIDLPGEVKGQLPPEAGLKELRLATCSFGQGVAVTFLQLASAYAAVANDGVRMKPYVVREIRDKNGKLLWEAHPEELGRAVSSQTAAILRRFFSGVVDSGTGRAAQIEGISVAGKTGTAEKPDLANRRYFKNRYIASFAGFFPADSPKIVGLIALDDPQGAHFGGEVAAPVFKRVAEKILALLSEPLRPSQPEVEPPALLRLASSPARSGLEPGRCPAELVPDFSGLSVRRAFQEASARRLSVRVKGRGIVKEQSVAPGMPADSARVLVLTCSSPYRNE